MSTLANNSLENGDFPINNTRGQLESLLLDPHNSVEHVGRIISEIKEECAKVCIDGDNILVSPTYLEKAGLFLQKQNFLRENVREILEHSGLLVNSFDEDGKLLYWGDLLQKVTGYTKEDIEIILEEGAQKGIVDFCCTNGTEVVDLQAIQMRVSHFLSEFGDIGGLEQIAVAYDFGVDELRMAAKHGRKAAYINALYKNEEVRTKVKASLSSVHVDSQGYKNRPLPLNPKEHTGSTTIAWSTGGRLQDGKESGDLRIGVKLFSEGDVPSVDMDESVALSQIDSLEAKTRQLAVNIASAVNQAKARRVRSITISEDQAQYIIQELSALINTFDNTLVLLERLPFGVTIYTLNEDGEEKLALMNQEEVNILGYSIAELRFGAMEKKYGYNPQTLRNVQHFLTKAKKGDYYQQETFCPKSKNGSIIPITYTTMPLWKEGKVIGRISIGVVDQSEQ